MKRRFALEVVRDSDWVLEFWRIGKMMGSVVVFRGAKHILSFCFYSCRKLGEPRRTREHVQKSD